MRAILTAVSSNLWTDYLVFYESVRRHHEYPIYVICLELTDWQLAHLAGQRGVVAVPLDDAEIYKQADKHWRQWYKPFYFELVPKEADLLWLDVDLVVLDSLEPLFAKAEEQFFVMADYFAPKSCLNKPELYRKHHLEIAKDRSQLVLNSGVIGIQPQRDRALLKLWQRKVNLAMVDQEIRSSIALFDQGALLWAMHELGVQDQILARKSWNYPARKNPYELDDKLWGRIKRDNPEAVIAHFAGLPKLSQLCEIDHQASLIHFRRKQPRRDTRRIIVTGLELAGIEEMAKTLRRSCQDESWVRTDLEPGLAHNVLTGQPFPERRLALYARQDCALACEASHHLSHYLLEIHNKLDTARFIILVKDPVELIRQRFLQFAIWPDVIGYTPEFYQADYRKFMADASKYGLGASNYFRETPEETELFDLHLWEVERSMRRLFDTIKELPPNVYRMVWAENLGADLPQLIQFAGKQFDYRTPLAQPRRRNWCDVQSRQWIEDQIAARSNEIYERTGSVLRESTLSLRYGGV